MDEMKAKILLENTSKLIAQVAYDPEEMQEGKELNWHEDGRGWQMYTITEVVPGSSVVLVYVRENRWGS